MPEVSFIYPAFRFKNISFSQYLKHSINKLEEEINVARNSGGGVFSKLVLLGLGAAIGAAMTQKKTNTDGTTTSQAGNLKENVKKGLDRFNEQSGGMVDKVKPTVSKAVEAVKGAIDSQQKMMDKEKDMLDKANETLQDDVGSSSGGSSASGSTSGTSTGTSSTSTTDATTSATGTTTPSGGIYGGSTAYTESLKKDLSDDDDSTSGSSSSNKSTFDK